MKKDWTNKEIQADPDGYLAWQKEQHGKAERERKKAEDKERLRAVLGDVR